MFVSRLYAVFVAAICLLVLAVACLAGLSDNGLDNIVNDVVVGHNNKGPYSLSWTDINIDSISVVVNGRSLKKGQDFNVDSSSGMLSFNSNVLSDAIVRVSYQTVPGKSKKASGGASVPVTLNVFQGQGANVKLTGLYAQNDPKNKDSGKTLIGLVGDKQWGSSKFTSTILMSQQSDDKKASGGSDMDRASYKFGGETNLGNVRFTGSMLKTGEQFAGEKEYGIGKGSNSTDLAASFAPGKALEVNAKFQQADTTVDGKKGKYSSVSEQSLKFAPSDSTKISMLHSQTESGTLSEDSRKSNESNLLRLDQNWGKTSAVASFENSNLTLGKSEDKVQNRLFSLTSSALDKVSLRAMMSQKSSDSNGEEQSLVFGASAKPMDKMDLDLGFSALDNEKVGHQTSTDLKVVTDVGGIAAVQAVYSTTDSTLLGQTSKMNVSVKANPLDKVQLQGSIKTDAKNEDQNYQRDFSLSSTPTDFAKLSATLSEKGDKKDGDIAKGAALELKAAANTKITAGYNYAETGLRTMTIIDYGATTKPFDFLSLSGSMRNRECKQDDAIDSTAVQMAIAPVKYFTLTGDYQMNPEDNCGKVQNLQAKSLGFSTRIGSLALLTNYSQKDEYMLKQMSDEQKFGLEMPMFGHGKLVTGFKQSRLLNGSESAIRTYTLGYNHRVGGDFNLSLSGHYTQYMKDKMQLPDKDEYSAEANLGLKF